MASVVAMLAIDGEETGKMGKNCVASGGVLTTLVALEMTAEAPQQQSVSEPGGGRVDATCLQHDV